MAYQEVKFPEVYNQTVPEPPSGRIEYNAFLKRVMSSGFRLYGQRVELYDENARVFFEDGGINPGVRSYIGLSGGGGNNLEIVPGTSGSGTFFVSRTTNRYLNVNIDAVDEAVIGITSGGRNDYMIVEPLSQSVGFSFWRGTTRIALLDTDGDLRIRGALTQNDATL